ncbi:unnamed protein product [Durusdinium trenchii]|uniref:Ion transport domain-containing protein n=1 Tax=Durusdinium trenchii TaxID=1381693 RepID=A0ABP0P7T0_9DINO
MVLHRFSESKETTHEASASAFHFRNRLLRMPEVTALEEHVQALEKVEKDVSAVRNDLLELIAQAGGEKTETLPRTTTGSLALSMELGRTTTHPHDTAAQRAFAGKSPDSKGRVPRAGSLRMGTSGLFLESEEHSRAIIWERPCSCLGFWPVLHPEGPPRLVWLTPAFVFVLAEAFLVPFMLAFGVEPDDEPFLGIAFRVVDLYFLLDIIVTCLTGYRDSRGNLVSVPGKIVKHYLVGWFLLDAVAAIPWTWIGDSSVAQVTRGLKVVRLIRLARLLRLAKLRQITEAAETYLEGNYAAELFMGFGKVLLLLSAVAHWGACFWHAVGSQQGGWVAELEEDYRGNENKVFARYTWSLYFTLTTLTTVGYGDITPVTTEECRWVLLLLLTSAVIFSGLLGMLSDLVASVNKEHRIVAAKKRQLARYMSWRAVPKTLLCKVRRYFLFKWGAQKDYDLYEEELKKALTPTLRSELCYHIYKEVLNAAPFLAWMRGHTACVKSLATSVRSGFHDCGDFLFRAGEEVKDIFILLAGTTILYRNDRDADAQEDEQDAFLPAWAELEGPGLASQRRALLRHMISSLVKRMKARKQRSTSLGRSRSNDLESQFVERWHDENLLRGLSELRKQDAVQKHAAMLIQLVWRERMRKKLDEIHKKHRPSSCYTIEAPAYFAESCLWPPLMTWSKRVCLHQYTVRVKSQVETVSIPRLAILLVIEKFSPWLRHRFEVFQAAVLEEKESIGETVSPKFSGKQSNVSTVDDHDGAHLPSSIRL